MSDLSAYIFNDYVIEFDPNASYSVFDEGYCRGIKFFDGTWNYEILNCQIGERLLINCTKTYHAKDLPFNLSTANFLPTYVKVRKRSE